MTRHAPALLALSVIAVAGWTYNVNYDTRAALDRLSSLRADIADEREALQVLRVEWAYLNAPDRLAGLVAAHADALRLVPLLPEGLGIAAAVPYPPRETPDVPPASPDALIAAAPPAPAAEPVPEATVVFASAEQEGAAVPAVLDASVAEPLPVAEPPPAETVPATLEAAIAAALVEAGVPLDDEPYSSGPRGGVIAVAPEPPVGIFAAVSAVPMPAARPAAWSRP